VSPTERAGEDVREWVHVACESCGHWRVAPLTKDEVADWLRTHGDARLRVATTHIERESVCPCPCGTPYDAEKIAAARAAVTDNDLSGDQANSDSINVGPDHD
jgi:hypothetical protein